MKNEETANEDVNPKQRKKKLQLKNTMNSHYIPTDVLEIILKQLDMKSVNKLRTVSKSWNYVSAQILESFRKVPMMLVLSPRHYDTQHLVISTANSDTNFKIRLKSFKDYYCLGSAFGWLALMSKRSKDNKDKPKITLLNPFSGAWIDLPPLTGRCDRPVICLTSPPTSSNYFVILLTKTWRAYKWKLGEVKWIDAPVTGYNSLIRFKDQLYGIDKEGCLFTIQEKPQGYTRMGSFAPTAEIRKMHSRYLIASNNNILLVGDPEEEIFEVFSLDLVSKVWKKINSLGDKAIFLDPQHSFIVSASEKGCKADCLYYFETRNEDETWRVYDLTTQITTVFTKSKPPSQGLKVWFYEG